jgi:folate-dependent tRNA-U54 methylase TrmFO/GidA
MTHLARDPGGKLGFQPSNITWSAVTPLDDREWRDARGRKLPKVERYEKMATRALDDLATWHRTAEVLV